MFVSIHLYQLRIFILLGYLTYKQNVELNSLLVKLSLPPTQSHY